MTNHEYVCSIQIKYLTMLVLLVLCHHADSIVKFLPGFEGPLPFELETGYIGVGEEEGVQLFYYFIKSERNPKEDPLFLWLTGGPCCSSANGLFKEIGPVTFKVDEGYDGSSIPTMVSTKYSWTKVANIIFLDQPVGVGYSYARTQRFDTPSDSGEAKRIHEFLRKWLSKHTEFISNQFYVTGNSYSGKIIPVVVQEISKGNDLGFKPQINLQGYAIGNPATDYDFDENHRIQFAHGMALISDELYELLKRSCRGNYVNVDPFNTECLKHVEEYQKCTSRINIHHILKPLCKIGSYDSYPRRYIEELLVANISVPYTDCNEVYINTILSRWNNDESVRKALHVVKGTIGKWARCNPDGPYNKNIKSSVPYHKNNSIKGYRSLVFSGDHDFLRPFISAQEWIRSLNYSIIDQWRPWMINNQVAGYTQSYANKMTFATVKGGGHTIDYKPAETFIMLQRWISGQLI